MDRLLAVMHRVGSIAFLLKTLPDEAGNLLFVFDNQNAHGGH